MALKRSIDTPTNTFATLNSLSSKNNSLSKGNLKGNPTGSGGTNSTMYVSSGKWYWEIYVEDRTSTSDTQHGISEGSQTIGNYLGSIVGGRGIIVMSGDNNGRRIHFDGSSAIQGPEGEFTINDGDIIQYVLDMNNGTLSVQINGTGWTEIFNGLVNPQTPAFNSATPGGSHVYNFGQNPTFSGQKTSSIIYTDASGYGEFYYEPPPGAMALCTANVTPANVVSAPYVVDETGKHSISVVGTRNVEISNKSPYLRKPVVAGSYNGVIDYGTGKIDAIGMQDYSVECWVYHTGNMSQQQTYLANYDNDTRGFYLYRDTSGRFQLYDGVVVATSGDTTIQANEWRHVCVMRSSGRSNLYVDGVKLGDDSAINPSGVTNYTETQIKLADSINSTNLMTGYLSGVRVIVGSLPYDTAGFIPPSAPPEVTPDTKYYLEESNSSFSPYHLTDVDMTLSPNARHAEMKSRASQNFKGGSYAIDRAAGLTIKGTETTTFGTGNYTIECWVYIDDIATQNYWTICDFRTGGSDTDSFFFGVRGHADSGEAGGGLYLHSGTTSRFFDQTLTSKTWHHVVLVRENNNINCFLDGVAGTSKTFSNNLSATHDLTIGWSYHAPTLYRLVGKIADFRLTKGEAKYGGAGNDVEPFIPPTEPLQLEEGKDQILLQPWKQAITLGGYKQADESQENARGHFKAVTWTGDDQDVREISVGLQPDLIWIKARNQSYNHTLFDSVRGFGKKHLYSDLASKESANEYGHVESVSDNNIVVNAGASDDTYVNNSGVDYVAWTWKAGGAPTVVNNSAGTISGGTGTVYPLAGQAATDNSVSIDGELQAGYEYPAADIYPYKMSVNTKSGFSILHYRPNKTGDSVTIPHGLGKKPAFIIVKNLVNGSSNWRVYHHSLEQGKSLILNDHTKGLQSDTNLFKSCDEQLMTFGRNGDIMSTWTNSVDDYICYAWAEIPGYSSFGHVYNESGPDGCFVNCGFKPSFVIWKNLNASRAWMVHDTGRNPNNPQVDSLDLSRNYAESTFGYGDVMNFVPNGFKLINDITPNYREAGEGFVYMAFADSSALGELKTKSKKNPISVNPKQGFKAIVWNGEVGTEHPLPVGFNADLTWIKSYNHPYHHTVYDSVRGYVSTKNLITNEDWAEGEGSSGWGHLEPDGNGNLITKDGHETLQLWVAEAGKKYVAWNWKAGGAPEAGFQPDDAMIDEEAALCSDIAAKAGATITPTSMSVGTETGFSITSYTGQNIPVRSIPHGLNKRPDMFIIKQLDGSNHFMLWHSSFSDPTGDFARLNDSRKKENISNFWGGESNDSLIYVGSDSYGSICGDNKKYICYAWHSVPGYSAFGGYVGTATPQFIYTGFKPAFLIAFEYSFNDRTYSSWLMYDNAREPYNTISKNLHANSLKEEGKRINGDAGVEELEFLSNGFRVISGNVNANGDSHIYMAFAEQPYEFATGR